MKIKLFCAAAITAFALSACGNSIDSKIDRLEKLTSEMQTAVQENDVTKIADLAKEAAEIGTYLQEHASDMSQEQAMRLLQVSSNMDNVDF